MKDKPCVKYKGELEAQNNPQHTGWLPITRRLPNKERARQRGSELKGQIDEGQIAYLELWPSAGEITLVCVRADPRRRANRNRGSSRVSAFP